MMCLGPLLYVSNVQVHAQKKKCVQDLVGAGASEAPESAHAVIAQLANRLARWDDRLFRKHYFGAADEVELKFVNRCIYFTSVLDLFWF
jgi:hypothetical protein